MHTFRVTNAKHWCRRPVRWAQGPRHAEPLAASKVVLEEEEEAEEAEEGEEEGLWSSQKSRNK